MKLLSVVLLVSMFQQFEVASIKRNVSDGRVRFETPPGRLNAINAPLRFLIRQAYRVPEARIIGGPSWLDTDRFDVVATTPEAATGDGIRVMLRTLLKERFGLALHAETREMPIYVLKTRSTGTLGPNMRSVAADCTGRSPAMVASKVQCGILVSPGSASASLRGGGATIEQFVRLLGDFLDRPLIDETGLTGTFDLELEFAAVPGSGVAPTASIDDRPSLFTAIQNQLGLKIEVQRGRADVWIIDAASHPRQD
jgi:bla regulator protein blaR1